MTISGFKMEGVEVRLCDTNATFYVLIKCLPTVSYKNSSGFAHTNFSDKHRPFLYLLKRLVHSTFSRYFEYKVAHLLKSDRINGNKSEPISDHQTFKTDS